MTIEPQREEESLETLVEGSEAAEEILDSLPEPESGEEDEEEVATQIHRQRLDGSMEASKAQEEPIEAPIGPADYESPDYVSPQVLEQAHTFLNRYGIKTDHLTPKEVMTKIAKIHAAKEEQAQVLSRGMALDGIERLLTFVPEGYIGEFKRENDMDVSRAEALGFKVFYSDKANLASSTGTPDGRVKLGDQVLMIIPEENHIAHRLVKAERLAERRKAHDPKGGAPIDQAESDPLYPLIKL